MNDHGDVTKVSQAPGNLLRKPKYETREEQQQPAPEETPEKGLLAAVEPVDLWHAIILVHDVVRESVPPFLVDFGLVHLRRPRPVHPDRGEEKYQAGPWMQFPRNRAATER